jgi:hypothetical protein
MSALLPGQPASLTHITTCVGLKSRGNHQKMYQTTKEKNRLTLTESNGSQSFTDELETQSPSIFAAIACSSDSLRLM